MSNNISIIGAGAWGSALAQTISSQNNGETILWTRTTTHADEINAHHENKSYLQGIALNTNIKATSDLENAAKSDILLMVTPAQAMRQILNDMKPYIRPEHVLVLCSKGIELETGFLMSQIANLILPEIPTAILSGPNFAHEIAIGKPAATTLACKDNDIALTLQNAVASINFRPYISNDIIGAQIAGALKNVIAIACGIAHGMNMGESARASLVTRGLAEITRLGIAMGARQETFLGLSGVGDIMLTCSSEKSRNFSLGFTLGQGTDINEALNNSIGIAEGYYSAGAAVKLAQQYNIQMPISMAVHKTLNERLLLDESLHEMLTRPLGYEI